MIDHELRASITGNYYVYIDTPRCYRIRRTPNPRHKREDAYGIKNADWIHLMLARGFEFIIESED